MNQNIWIDDLILQKMTQLFLGIKIIDNYYILKKYIQIKNSRIQIFFTNIHKQNIDLKASILYIHGLGEHSSRNYNIATRLSDLGYDIYMIDFKGHGYSFGPKTYASQKNLIENIYTAFQEIRTDLPCFLMGHSMGGGSILAFSQLNPNLKLAGIICSNPFIEFGDQEKDPYQLSNDPVIIQKTMQDPLQAKIIRIKIFKALLYIEKINFHLVKQQKMKYPILMLLGEDDNLTRPKYALNFMNLLNNDDKRIQIIKKGRHEILHETQDNGLWELLEQWLDAKSKKAQNFCILKRKIPKLQF